MAFLIPVDLFLLCLVKKLTVIGIIGNTQGVSKAAKPLIKDKKKITSRDLFEDSSPSLVVVLSELPDSSDEHPFTDISKSSSYGGRQWVSSQV